MLLGTLLLACAAAAPGCKPASCETVCESLNECPATTMKTADCAKSCADAKASAAKSGCSTEYDSMVSCQGTVSACNADTFCAGQNAAYLKCVTDACKKDPKTCGG